MVDTRSYPPAVTAAPTIERLHDCEKTRSSARLDAYRGTKSTKRLLLTYPGLETAALENLSSGSEQRLKSRLYSKVISIQ